MVVNTQGHYQTNNECGAMETRSAKCRRCGLPEPYIILDKVHLECRNCFLLSCTKKIRSAIGCSRQTRNNDSILISYSSGPSSLALLDLMKSSIDSDLRREQKFRPSILHIDMQSVLHPDQQLHEFSPERRKRLEELLSDLRRDYPGWPIYWSTIETCITAQSAERLFATYNGSCDNGAHLLSNDESHIALHESMRHSGDLTDQQQYVTQKISKFITQVAADINATISRAEDRLKFIFTGSTATQLANNLLVDVILGRGGTIRSTVSICDKTHPVPILRPMREFSKKEIAYYLLARNIQLPVEANLLTKADRRSCIQTATESFLSKLDVDYPSTYNTLLKTGNKMQD